MTDNSSRIVICGAGIAGVAAAYFLAVEHGCRNVVLVEADNPLSLTSDKSTEAYRNWWPGPDGAMTAFMNRSIDLIEGIANSTTNRINLNRRGYLFATADHDKTSWLHDMACLAEKHGAGAVRVHTGAANSYSPTPLAPTDISDPSLSGADLITDPALIRKYFPYLQEDTVAVAHARRAGSLSAQQLGMFMLEQARAHGVILKRGQVKAVRTNNNQVQSVEIEHQGKHELINTTQFVVTAGPMLKSVAALMGIELPVYAERHLKISLADSLGIIPRQAPMLIWLDPQHLPWSEDERAVLSGDPSARWLLDQFPAGVHCRPEGSGSSQTLLGLYTYHGEPADIIFPLPEDPHYPEIVLRGLSTMIPALGDYLVSGARSYVDGGYYIRTRENRPLIGPLPVQGAFVSGAFSGFGIMASCAGGDLLARHVLRAPLPAYAPAFTLSRYQDAEYLALLDNWGDDGQL